MLKHTAIGPLNGGRYFAAYQTPGASCMTTVTECSSLAQAQTEADRLNGVQLRREKFMRDEAHLLGRPGIYPSLKGVN